MNPTSAVTFGRMAPGVFARDIQKASAFYCDILGFEKTFENGDPVGFVILKKDLAEIHLSLVKDHQPSTTNVAGLLVDDVDALHAICVASGVRIIKSLADKDYGLRAFVFADLDGNRIDVGQRIGAMADRSARAEASAGRPRFEQQDLRRSVFKTCSLANVEFEDVDLSLAAFSNVNLSQASFANVNLAGASIDNAKIDGLTIFGHDVQTLIRADLARKRSE